ncbi:serine protease 1-like [Drosophila gunungcola]|uniref:serine protease 1-like n=1 Tax=Drosophila gunungcola TaxID=103775 RepID=UPI0022E3F4D5|nr:serine protease 1-like [Drosophila gunungcola]
MKIVLMLLILTSLVFVSAGEKKAKPRIYGGYSAQPFTVIYMVGILVAESYSSAVEFGAGTVISNQWVLTVGSLLKYEFVEVHTGSRRPWWGWKIFRVYSENYYIHPNKKHDLGLLKCPYMKFDKRLHRALVPNLMIRDYRWTGNLTLVCGWGKTSKHSQIENWLNCIQVKIISNTECAKSYPQVESFNVCTSGAGNKGVCEGDIGGPVVTLDGRPTFVGVIHLMPGNCKGEHPSIHIRTSDHLNWIKAQANVHFPSHFGD